MEPMRITVVETATIFDGPEHIYRYDLPESGIVAGWALAAVVDQIKTIAGECWPDIEVAVAGSERATEMLTRTLLNKGIAAFAVEALEEPVRSANPEIQRPTTGKNRAVSLQLTWFHAAMAAVIVTVVGISWWGLGNAPQGPPGAAGGATAAAEAPPTSSRAAATTPSSSPALTSVVVEYDRVRVNLPPEFTLAPRADGKLVAAGKDPNFRIIIAVDPVHRVDPAAVRREVELMVSRDSALSPLPGEKLRGDVPTVDYHEDPGDGSNVRWATWVEHDYQFSVGCHSRFESAIAHRAACRMAAESLTLRS